MSDWTAGYVADIGYTFGYYPELNPLRLPLALANAGLAAPGIRFACELGFGQGISTNLHAASSSTQWHGNDFNPDQVLLAQEMADASGAEISLSDQSFAEYCGRPDLPAFDFIGLHGTWSWISDENRKSIIDFVHRKLKVGGVFYISYNAQPGWAAMVPMRELLLEHSDVLGAPGVGIVSRINEALDFADRLFATNPAFARVNPQVVDRLKVMRDLDRHYLAHEYFNRDWHPMSFSRLAEWLAPAKLRFACSANYLDFIDAVNLTTEQQSFLGTLPDHPFRQTVRDFMVNNPFRRDYWVKGARTLSPLERVEVLREQRVVLLPPREDVSLIVKSTSGAVTMQQAIYGPILDLLADHRPTTLAEIESRVQSHGIAIAQLIQAVIVLIGSGNLALAQDEARTAAAKPRTDRLNSFFCEQAKGGGENPYLVSPVVGGGIGVGRIPKLFRLAQRQGLAHTEEWARFAWTILSSQGEQLLKDGRRLATAEENLAELSSQAHHFRDTMLPIIRALEMV